MADFELFLYKIFFMRWLGYRERGETLPRDYVLAIKLYWRVCTMDEDPVLAKKPGPGLCTSNLKRFFNVY